MFAPTRDEVRAFFRDTWRKALRREVLTPLESMAAAWIEQHPEYHEVLGQAETPDFSVESGQTNPFLHLSMHLSIDEQISIDQPRGIRDAAAQLAATLGTLHDAHHHIMECLGEMLWTAQRNGLPPDGERYIECVRQRAQR